jgi:hypothetical protein
MQVIYIEPQFSPASFQHIDNKIKYLLIIDPYILGSWAVSILHLSLSIINMPDSVTLTGFSNCLLLLRPL